MAISYGQFTLWVSVSYVVKSEHSCTSHKPRASYQRWLVRGDLQHEICPHAATQSYIDIRMSSVYLRVTAAVPGKGATLQFSIAVVLEEHEQEEEAPHHR